MRRREALLPLRPPPKNCLAMFSGYSRNSTSSLCIQAHSDGLPAAHLGEARQNQLSVHLTGGPA